MVVVSCYFISAFAYPALPCRLTPPQVALAQLGSWGRLAQGILCLLGYSHQLPLWNPAIFRSGRGSAVRVFRAKQIPSPLRFK